MRVASLAPPAPVEELTREVGASIEPDLPWVALVWNDPVNLMSYVTWVFQKHFGYSRERSEQLMLDVHHKGRAVVANGSRESMERHAEALQGYGLWATFQKDD